MLSQFPTQELLKWFFMRAKLNRMVQLLLNFPNFPFSFYDLDRPPQFVFWEETGKIWIFLITVFLVQWSVVGWFDGISFVSEIVVCWRINLWFLINFANFLINLGSSKKFPKRFPVAPQTFQVIHLIKSQLKFPRINEDW